MSGFTKLVPDIVQSSIWNESSDVRVVWITMLAIKNEIGYVRGDEKTIARLANVSVQAATEALDVFQKPDPSSQSKEDDGKRIRPAPGGWIVINHDLYRTGDRTEYMREYMRDYRSNTDDVNNVNSDVNKKCKTPSASVSSSAGGKEGAGRKGGRKPRGPLKPYGELENVKLSEAEYSKLLASHGQAKLDAGIEVLDSYIGTKRRDPYASHYAAMKSDSWVWDRVLQRGMGGVAPERRKAG